MVLLLALMSTLLGCSSRPSCPSQLEAGLFSGLAVGAPALATVAGKRTDEEMLQRRMTVNLKALGDQKVPAQAKIYTSIDLTTGLASYAGTDTELAVPGRMFLVYLAKSGSATAVIPVEDEATARALDARIRTPGCNLWQAG